MLILTPKVSKEVDVIIDYCVENHIECLQLQALGDIFKFSDKQCMFYGGDVFCLMALDVIKSAVRSPDSESVSRLLDLVTFDMVGRNIKIINTSLRRGFSGQKFVKPIDYKFFKHGIYSQDEVSDLVGQGYKHDGKMGVNVIVSDVVEFQSEHRFFKNSDLEIYTSSIYSGVENGAESKSIQDFFFDNIYKNKLFDNMAVDIGYIKGYGAAIVEFNPIYCSSLYDCDVDVFIKCLTEYFT